MKKDSKGINKRLHVSYRAIEMHFMEIYHYCSWKRRSGIVNKSHEMMSPYFFPVKFVQEITCKIQT